MKSIDGPSPPGRSLLALLAVLGLGWAPLPLGGAEAKLRYEVKARSDTINLLGRVWLDATLTNEGDSTVVVYWGDRAHAKMYLFEVTGPDREVIPTSQYTYRDAPLPIASRQRYFRTLGPGATLKYAMVLGSTIGANTQWASFAQSGEYSIEPSLHVVTDQLIDPNVDNLVPVPGAWTGTLFAPVIKVQVNHQIDPTSVAMAGDTTIQGFVVDPDGKPVVGAEVHSEIRIQGGGFDGWARIAATSCATDKSGKFILRRLNHASPDYKLTVSHPDFPIEEKILVNPGKTELETKIQLQPGVDIRGVVQLPSGAAMQGVRVSAGYNGRMAYTNERGEFTIKSAANRDKYSVSCARGGFYASYPQVNRKTATDGSWTIVMQRETTLHGIAVLLDGTPLKNAQIEFKFRPAGKPDSQPRGDRTRADRNGRFQVTMPSAGPFDILALAEDTSVERHLPHDAWETLVENVGPTKEEIVFEFDNTAALKLLVAPTAALPNSLRLQASVYRKNLDNHRQPFRQHSFPAKGGEIVWKNISGGEFLIDLNVENSEGYQWQQTVDVATGGKPREVVFKIPKLEFGELKGRVLMPNGKPGSVSLWYDSSRGHGLIHPDAEGRFQLPVVSAGKLWVSSRDTKWVGRAATTVPNGGVGEVELRLQDRDKITGLVQGTARLADGTPLVGATTEEFHFGFVKPAGKPGFFEQRLPVGESHLTVHLSRSRIWQEKSGRVLSDNPQHSRHFQPHQHESITKKLTVKSGVNRHDITLSTNFVNLTVHMKNRDPRQAWNVEVSSDLSEEPRAFRYRRHQYSAGVYDEQPSPDDLESTKKLEFIGVLKGRTFVIARHEGEILWKKVPPSKTEVTLDPSQTGRIDFALMDERGQALKNGALRIEAKDLPDTRFIWAPERDQADQRPRRDKWAEIDAQGATLFSPMSVGAYLVSAAAAYSGDEWHWSEPQQIQLQVGETTKVRALLKDGKITWRDP